MRTVDIRVLAKCIEKFVSARHCTGKSSANADMMFANRLATEHRIKCYQLEHVDRRKIQLLRDPIDRFIGNISEMFLKQVQKRQRGTALENRVMRDCFVNHGLELGRNFHS